MKTLSSLLSRVRHGRLHGQADPDAEEPLPRPPEDGRAEEERGVEREQRRGRHERRRSRPPRNAKADGKSDSRLRDQRYGPPKSIKKGVRKIESSVFVVNLKERDSAFVSSLPELCDLEYLGLS